MQKSVVEEHPELFHYTNAAGLAGIIQSQTLWATHYAYLNDSEEIKFFLEKRFPDILQPIIDSSLDEYFKQNPAEQSVTEREGGKDKVANRLIQEITTKQKDILLNLAEPYIFSFCSTKNKDVSWHGLLSQWRGYGRDDGYAISFDTARLSELLKKAGKKWENDLDLFFGDVVYSSDPDQKFRDEFEEDLNVIKSFSEDSLRGNSEENIRELDKIFPALMKCTCRYKHWGFKEENEVRIIAIPHPTRNKKFCELTKADGITIQEMPRKHYLRSGTLVPYIDLFEGVTSVSENPLPIERIIVGPSTNDQEKQRRVRAAELLIAQYGIKDVQVSASEIPYIGR